ncbi:MAG TPA: YqgE/AlgH family protein [Thermodesulfovibrionia bacterium]|nr:YqgE/AlgH family protein [Thermodesulfovibrionia bacterium]
MESLKGNFLISMPHMNDPNFAKTVVYLCEHTEEGAMGLVINKPLLHIDFADVLRQLNITVPDFQLPNVHFGGPVELYRGFCLHSFDYQISDTIRISETISLTANKTIIRDIAKKEGPEHLLFLMGYAGWAPSQLEYEITENGWLIVPADDEILFSLTDDRKWEMAAKNYGIDITLMNEMVGNA